MSDRKWDVSKLDSGGRNALKRNAGIMMGDQIRALEAFYQAASDLPKNREREAQWYACMCMECLWKPEDHPKAVPFEDMLRSMYQSKDTSESIKHRIISLMDVPWSEDGYLLGKLCNFARLFRSKNSSLIPDFSQLADDLAKWNHTDRFIQRRWIRTICETRNEKETEQNKEDTENVN